MIHESRDSHYSGAIGCGRIGAELLGQLPYRRLRLFLAEPLHTPRNLPVLGRRIDYVIRFRNVLATVKLLRRNAR